MGWARSVADGPSQDEAPWAKSETIPGLMRDQLLPSVVTRSVDGKGTQTACARKRLLPASMVAMGTGIRSASMVAKGPARRSLGLSTSTTGVRSSLPQRSINAPARTCAEPTFPAHPDSATRRFQMASVSKPWRTLCSPSIPKNHCESSIRCLARARIQVHDSIVSAWSFLRSMSTATMGSSVIPTSGARSAANADKLKRKAWSMSAVAL